MTGAVAVLNMRGLMAHALRDLTTPAALARARQVIEFQGKLSEFKGLAAALARDLERLDADDRPDRWRDSTVEARLEFGFADVRETLPTVTGRATVNVPVVCQRCLEPFGMTLTAEIRYVLLASGEAVGESSEIEVWELEASSFRPFDLVEEALLMALPVSALHPNADDCGPLAERIAPGTASDREGTRPFADLRSRMSGEN